MAHHRVTTHHICDLLKLLKLCYTRVHCEPDLPAGDLHGTVEDVGGRVWRAVEPLVGLADPAEELLVKWRQSVAMLAEQVAVKRTLEVEGACFVNFSSCLEAGSAQKETFFRFKGLTQCKVKIGKSLEQNVMAGSLQEELDL